MFRFLFKEQEKFNLKFVKGIFRDSTKECEMLPIFNILLPIVLRDDNSNNLN